MMHDTHLFFQVHHVRRVQTVTIPFHLTARNSSSVSMANVMKRSAPRTLFLTRLSKYACIPRNINVSIKPSDLGAIVLGAVEWC